jgi:Cell wall-active antibiotics response 4TMS YvqF
MNTAGAPDDPAGTEQRQPTEPIPPAEPSPPADRHGPAAATVLVGALLVLVGIAWLLDAAGVEVPWRAVLPAALIAVGLACVAGAFRGRQHALMVVGVALMAVLSVAVAADWDLDVPLAGGVGDRTERPVSPAELTEYELGVGNLVVDLRQLQVPPGTTVVEARVGIGELDVELPDGVSVQVEATSGLGEVQVLGQEEGGFGSRVETTSEVVPDRRLRLDLRVGLGQVRVER